MTRESTRQNARTVSLAMLFAALVGACGLPPSEICQQYLECQDHHDQVLDRPPATDTNIYQADGTCWENDDLAERCNEACENRIETLRLRLVDREQDLGPCE
jgi:hypothetical protein